METMERHIIQTKNRALRNGDDVGLILLQLRDKGELLTIDHTVLRMRDNST